MKNGLMSRMGKSRRAAVVLAVAAAAAVVPATGASAGTSCNAVFGCSTTWNDSNLFITVRHDWNCSGSTGTANPSPTCVSGASLLLNPGDITPAHQDWDVVRVDAGWCYKIEFLNWWGKDWTETYNRIGQGSPTYVKVEDGSLAAVRAQSSTSCP